MYIISKCLVFRGIFIVLFHPVRVSSVLFLVGCSPTLIESNDKLPDFSTAKLCVGGGVLISKPICTTLYFLKLEIYINSKPLVGED